MSAEDSLYDLLVADSTVMGYVRVSGSSPDEGRIYPTIIPDRIDLPAVSFLRVGTEYTQVIHDAPPSSEQATFEIICVAATRTTADALADAVQDAIAGDFVLNARSSEQDFEQNIYGAIISATTTANL